MSRLPLHTTPDGLDGEALDVFRAIEKSRGFVLGVFAALMNSPKVAQLVADLGGYMRFGSVLPDAVRELTILASLRECDCQFEWSFHEGFALKAGIPQETIDVVKYGRDLATVAPEHAEIIQGARELLSRHRICDPTLAALTARHDTQTVTELIALVGYYAMASCVLNAFEVPAHPGAVVLPERPLVSTT
ncbi:MAG: 4-carboxymuconolactone decarboxylase [Solirubrobacteraceae bacterium]|nr:4-carboxymuconolactone decarboxylase [Solirubrobacteraceae bacterium]